ncbi:hypothetical protein [Streptomyces sp. NPDC007100]|uniref:hypothetical protein n=1 Tax=unclassified Streptomyces TaxID=2593676 RepID=UPI0033C77512
MPMSIKVIIFALGGLMILAALLGSGFSVREISFPRISPVIRAATVVLGVGLIITSIILLATESKTPVAQPQPQPSPSTNSPSSAAPTTPAPETTPPSTDASTPTRGSEAAANELLTHVPSAVRGGCLAIDASDLPDTATAGLRCSSDDGFNTDYWQFSDSGSMQSEYAKALKGYEFTSKSCASSSDLNGQSDFTYSGETAGSMSCFLDSDGYANIMWTYDELAIVSLTYSPEANYGALRQWWAQAGPVPGSTV